MINKIWRNRFSFETVGNYVFKISEREIEKIAMGLGFPCDETRDGMKKAGYMIIDLAENPYLKTMADNAY